MLDCTKTVDRQEAAACICFYIAWSLQDELLQDEGMVVVEVVMRAKYVMLAAVFEAVVMGAANGC